MEKISKLIQPGNETELIKQIEKLINLLDNTRAREEYFNELGKLEAIVRAAEAKTEAEAKAEAKEETEAE